VAVYRRSNRTRYVLAVLILAALTLVTVDARTNHSGVLGSVRSQVADVFSPLQRATHAVLQPIGNFLTGAVDYGSLKAENQRLRRQLATEQAQAAEAQAEKADYEQLFAVERLPFLAGIAHVTVQVIDNSSSNFENSVTVNKGTADGIAVGQPVVAAGGLVGSVQSASAHEATIVLLTDPTFDVGVGLSGGNIGSAQGLGRTQPLKVTVDTPQLAPPTVKKGDTVLTSGLDTEKFPKNIPVGTVISAPVSPINPEPEITLKPLVNLNDLFYLDVLLWAPQ
jgi:rod shape-determining protein MreC